MHILILINNLSYKKRYPYSLPSIQLWECPFSLPKGACYQSVEMLPIKWVNKVSCYCLIFICLIIIEMDHFFISLMDIYTPSFTNFLFEFFVNFLFGWLSFFKFLVLNVNKIIWVVIFCLYTCMLHIFFSQPLTYLLPLFFIFSNKSLICWFSLWFLVLFHAEKALRHPTIISLCFIHFLLAIL